MVKELLKEVYLCQNYPKNKTCTFFMALGLHVVNYQHVCMVYIIILNMVGFCQGSHKGFGPSEENAWVRTNGDY